MKTHQPFDIYPRTFNFGVQVIKLVDRLPRTIAGTEIGKQLLRSGTSVGANLREAGSAESHKDFVHKIAIARKETQESHYWLELIDATIFPGDSDVACLTDESDQLARILHAISHRKQTGCPDLHSSFNIPHSPFDYA